MTLSIFLTPALYYFNILDAENALLFAFIASTVIQTPLWVIAGFQDWMRHEVDSVICILIMAFTALHAILFTGLGMFLFVALLAYLTFRDKEIALIGQADFMLMAHWISTPFVYSSGAGVMFVSSTVFLLCIIIYIAVYRDKDGKRWHRGMMVPLLPPYSASVVLLLLYQYPLSKFLFYLGA